MDIFLFETPLTFCQHFFKQVGYATALDVFIILCFFIVFAALVEFACLNFLDTLVRRLKRREMERKKYQVIMNQRYCDMPKYFETYHTIFIRPFYL